MKIRHDKADRIRVAGRLALLLVLCMSVSGTVRADLLDTGSKPQRGTLEGYDGNNFQFRDDRSGKLLEVSRSSVRNLKLDEPRKAEVVIAGKPPFPEKILVRGYDDGLFLFTENGKELRVMGMKVSRIKLDAIPRPGREQESAPTVTEQIAEADINKLLAQPNLTADQKTTLEHYRDVNGKYRDFLAKSSAMVSAMDVMKGAERQKALNDLRIRKEEEQPLKREMEESQRALIQAFPELLTGHVQAMPSGDSGNVEFSETITVALPRLGENEVMIIDTGIFKQLGNLTDTQNMAIRDYEAVVAAYQKQSTIPAPGELDAAKKRLAVEQVNLFKVFPAIHFVQESE